VREKQSTLPTVRLDALQSAITETCEVSRLVDVVGWHAPFVDGARRGSHAAVQFVQCVRQERTMPVTDQHAEGTNLKQN
jgi:hypothetical protein